MEKNTIKILICINIRKVTSVTWLAVTCDPLNLDFSEPTASIAQTYGEEMINLWLKMVGVIPVHKLLNKLKILQPLQQFCEAVKNNLILSRDSTKPWMSALSSFNSCRDISQQTSTCCCCWKYSRDHYGYILSATLMSVQSFMEIDLMLLKSFQSGSKWWIDLLLNMSTFSETLTPARPVQIVHEQMIMEVKAEIWTFQLNKTTCSIVPHWAAHFLPPLTACLNSKWA